MNELSEFLRARIAEDETEARNVAKWVATIKHPAGSSFVLTPSEMIDGAFTPARVLAECAAKRRIVEHAAAWAETLHETPDGWTETGATAYRMAMEWTLRHLALPYAEDDDYDEEYRP